MIGSDRWSRVLVIVGLVAMLIGAVDPLEGSIIILVGTALVAIGAWLGKSRYLRLLCWASALVTVGVGALWSLSGLGGIGAGSGRSNWWGLVLVPYAVGWITGLVGAIQRLRETTRTHA